MFIHNLMDKVNKEKRMRRRVEAAHHLAVGMSVFVVIGACVATGILLTTKSGKEMRKKMTNKAIDTVENVKHIVIKKADALEDSVAHTADNVRSVIEASQNKAEDIIEKL